MIEQIIEKSRIRSEQASRPLQTNISLAPIEIGTPVGSPFQTAEKYRLGVELFVTFWSSRAMLPEVRKQAEQTLLQLLHEDVLRHVAALKLAVMGDDNDAALALCDQIEKDLGL